MLARVLTAAVLILPAGGYMTNTSSDNNRRMKELMAQSEDLRKINDELERYWMIDQPSHLTEERVHGGVVPDEPFPSEPAHKLLAIWQNDVAQAHDPLADGKTVPCLTGKLYLFGEGDTGIPVRCARKVTNEVFDESSGKRVLLHRWEYPAEVVRRLGKKDAVGWCYVMPLPLPDGLPPLTKVRIRTSHFPSEGAPLSTETILALNAPAPVRVRPLKVAVTVANVRKEEVTLFTVEAGRLKFLRKVPAGEAVDIDLPGGANLAATFATAPHCANYAFKKPGEVWLLRPDPVASVPLRFGLGMNADPSY